jgi:uncharacterized protein (TIGR03084 family)
VVANTDAGGIVAAVAEQHDELAEVLAGLSDADWHQPTRCEGWTVADVVLHLAQTDELATASVQGRFAQVVNELTAAAGGLSTVDEGAAAMVARERGLDSTAIRDRWAKGAATLRSLLAAADSHQRVVWVAGELSVRTLATTRLAECWIHTGDVADGVGVQLAPPDRLRYVARLAWRTLPYAFGRAGRELSGPVAFELRGPNGDAWDFGTDDAPATVIRGDGAELCLVAARRLGPAATSLRGDGPDAEAVLELVRTYA